MTLDEILARLDRNKQRLDAMRPLPPESLASFRDWLRVEVTYTSNAIEGNSLTRQETGLVLEGLTIGGKPLRDHLEALDHAEAFDFMLDLAQGTSPFTEGDLRSIHHLVLQRSAPQHAGRYRDIQVWIRGSAHMPPSPVEIPALMADLFREFYAALPHEHPVSLVARFHARLVHIHPFADGNGRTARLAANFQLLRAGYPVAILLPDQAARKGYFAALRYADEGHFGPITRLFAEASARSAGMLLKGLEPAHEVEDSRKERRSDRADDGSDR